MEDQSDRAALERALSESIPADSPLAAALSCSSLCLRTQTSPRSYREHFVRMIQNCFAELNGAFVRAS
jgi:hypothetical protein